jgi:hypothetical protein
MVCLCTLESTIYLVDFYTLMSVLLVYSNFIDLELILIIVTEACLNAVKEFDYWMN